MDDVNEAADNARLMSADVMASIGRGLARAVVLLAQRNLTHSSRSGRNRPARSAVRVVSASLG